VYTIIETPVYARKAADLLEDAFVAFNPKAGSVIPRSGGIRKLRWRTIGGGKRGGHRVIYFNRLQQGQIWLLTIFSKQRRSNISTSELILIRKAIDDGR
jgi:hypothetical protein